jgi:hypothetical protein
MKARETTALLGRRELKKFISEAERHDAGALVRHLARIHPSRDELVKTMRGIQDLERKATEERVTESGRVHARGRVHLVGAAYQAFEGLLAVRKVKRKHLAELLELAHSLHDHGHGFVQPLGSVRETLSLRGLEARHTGSVIELAHAASENGEDPTAALDTLRALAQSYVPGNAKELVRLGLAAGQVEHEPVLRRLYGRLLDIGADTYQQHLPPRQADEARRAAALSAARAAVHASLRRALRAARAGESPLGVLGGRER